MNTIPSNLTEPPAAYETGTSTSGERSHAGGATADASPPGVSLAGGLPESVLRIPVSVQVIIGTARMALSHLAQLGPGATIALDQKLGAPATILVNGKEVARGELFVLDGEGGGDQLGITITEVISPGRVPDR